MTLHNLYRQDFENGLMAAIPDDGLTIPVVPSTLAARMQHQLAHTPNISGAARQSLLEETYTMEQWERGWHARLADAMAAGREP